MNAEELKGQTPEGMSARAERVELLREIALLKEDRRAQRAMIVGIVGGTVEGQPTNQANYLQRIRHLVWWEKASMENEVHLNNERTKAWEQRDKLLSALKELYALVWGECPSLLNEDSGGDVKLDEAVKKAIDFVEGIEQTHRLSCMRCGKSYEDFPLDVLVTDDVWQAISGREDGGGVMCVSCMVERGAKMPGVTVARLSFE